MVRKALIIYMTNSPSGKLGGPAFDYKNLCSFLTSDLGGNWYQNEITSLENPEKSQVIDEIFNMSRCDYALVVFSGHGELEEETDIQYIELMNCSIPIKELTVNCKRQTIIIDACRHFFSFRERLFNKKHHQFSLNKSNLKTVSTRDIFDNSLSKAEEGLTILYSASENETALDTDNGTAYISSLIESAQEWEISYGNENIFSVKDAHKNADKYLHFYFETIQKPKMNYEKRLRYFPFAVKNVGKI
jgi:hypothetical protein